MQSLTPQTPIRSWAVMSCLDGGQRWKIEHAKNPSVTTLAELAAWGRPKQGQWSGFGKTKIAAWTAILAEAGLEWRGMAPMYPRGNPMYSSITPLTEEPEDIVYRLQVAIDSGWLGRFPLTERDIIADAIREIRGLRSGQDALMGEAEIGRQAMNLARSELAAAKAELVSKADELVAMRQQRDIARREACSFEAIDRWHEANPKGILSPCAVFRIAREIAAKRGWDCYAKKEGGGA